MRNLLVSDVLIFSSLKSLQIKTKYISERHIKLKQKLETCYPKLTNGQNPVLFCCYWVFCFVFFSQKVRLLNIITSSCIKIGIFFNKISIFIPLWWYHSHCRVKCYRKINPIPNIWSTTRKAKKIKSEAMLPVSRQTWLIWPPVPINWKVNLVKSVMFFLIPSIQFSYTERNPKYKRRISSITLFVSGWLLVEIS